MLPTHFLYLISPPRPDFITTITAEEREIMARHAAFLRLKCDEGLLLMAGPTLDGTWGVGVLQTSDRAVAEQFAAEDPAATSGLMTPHLHPWMASISRLPPTSPAA